MQLGLGQLGLSPDVFWNLSFYELRQLESAYVQQWETGWQQTRLLLWQQAEMNRNPKKKGTPYKPEDFVHLPSDTVQKAPRPTGPPLSREEFERLAQLDGKKVMKANGNPV